MRTLASAGNAGQRERDRDELENGDGNSRVDQEGEHRNKTRQPVIEDHKERDHGEADGAGQQTAVDRFLSERWPDCPALHDVQRNGKRACLELNDEVGDFRRWYPFDDPLRRDRAVDARR